MYQSYRKLCHFHEGKNNFLFSIYGISKFGTKVEQMSNNYPNELLKFEVKMFNFKGKSLPEDKVNILFYILFNFFSIFLKIFCYLIYQFFSSYKFV